MQCVRVCQQCVCSKCVPCYTFKAAWKVSQVGVAKYKYKCSCLNPPPPPPLRYVNGQHKRQTIPIQGEPQRAGKSPLERLEYRERGRQMLWNQWRMEGGVWAGRREAVGAWR